MAFDFRSQLRQGIAIPAHPPLALTSNRRLDERRQLALARYYIAAGVGGLAVGVHTTQVANAEGSSGKPGRSSILTFSIIRLPPSS